MSDDPSSMPEDKSGTENNPQNNDNNQNHNFEQTEKSSKTGSTGNLFKLLGSLVGKRSNEESLLEAIEELIEESLDEDGDRKFSSREHALLGNILKLHDLRTIDVMTPRVDIAACSIDKSLKELAQMMIEKGFSRVPIFKRTLDDIVGIVHVKDILQCLAFGEKKTIAEVMNPEVNFVSPAMRILDLLHEMQLKRNHVVLVVDEYGGVDGLVTIEDIVEQIVGEIEDEHDLYKKPVLIIREDGTIEADARAELEDFERMVGKILTEEELEDEDIDTLGGLVTQIAGRIPARGEIITHSSGMQFRIIEVDPRRIKRLTVFNLPTPPNPDREPYEL